MTTNTEFVVLFLCPIRLDLTGDDCGIGAESRLTGAGGETWRGCESPTALAKNVVLVGV